MLCLSELEIKQPGVSDVEGIYLHTLLSAALFTEQNQQAGILSFDSAYIVSVAKLPKWALVTGLYNNWSLENDLWRSPLTHKDKSDCFLNRTKQTCQMKHSFLSIYQKENAYLITFL